MNKPQSKLPASGKLISTWIKEIIPLINKKDQLFYRVTSNEVVELGKIKVLNDKKDTYTGIKTIKPNRFITIIEEYLTPGNIIYNKENKEFEFKEKSITAELANTALVSNLMHGGLPQLQRVFRIPLPIKHSKKITFPKLGYDARFGSWLPYDTPTISNPKMTLKEAKTWIYEIYKEFCFESQRDAHLAIAGLLTPFLRGIYPEFTTRTPVFFYMANRERSGKDFCAGVTGIICEGQHIQDTAISTSEKFGSNSEELRKKIMASLMGGRTRIHFANNKGHINNAVFEGITTTESFSDRVLGKNQNLTFPNEMDFSLSGNSGVTYTADFANRCRFVRLFLEDEDANKRVFQRPNLLGWVKKNREQILSALYALVRNWEKKGCPKGKEKFASFPDWAEICGGIMESAGYLNPCLPEKNDKYQIGDSETIDMKALFEEIVNIHKSEQVGKQAIVKIVIDNDFFPWLDLSSTGKKNDKMQFGILLTKYIGRRLSGIKMVDTKPKARPARKEYIFVKKDYIKPTIDFFGSE